MKISKVMIIVLGTLLVMTIFAAAKASAEGMTLISLETKHGELSEQNQELKRQLVTSASLSQVSKKADEIGMIKPEKFIYLTGSGIALR